MSSLRIYLLGRFHVESDGKPITNGLDSRKVQELFSYLLVSRDRPHPREALADLLWGDNSNVQARKYLRQALWQLQTALKSDGEPDENSLVFAEAEWVGINQRASYWLDIKVL